jgi:hypothetical protein
MELGTGGIDWFTYVPEFRGNRDLPEDQRLSLEIRCLRPVDMLAEFDDSPDQLYRWRDEALATQLEDPDYGPQIKRFGLEVLQTMRVFVEHTRGFRNFVFGGQALGDPAEVFVRLPISPDQDAPERGKGITQEINEVIKATAGMEADDLKNYVAQCSGISLATTQTSTDAPTAPSAPAETEPCAADTQAAPTA